MVPEMVEHCAKALEAELAKFDYEWKVGWFCSDDHEKLARAAIAALVPFVGWRGSSQQEADPERSALDGPGRVPDL